jgi:DNA-binding CsgD family transcriptional regulator
VAVDQTLVADTRVVSLLSPRELEVLEMTSRGLTNVEVGRRLNLTVHGVKFHLASIYRKLHVSNRTEAATVYLRGMPPES